MHFKNDILWIFSATNPEIIPSYVVGGIMPANYLKIQKIIFLKNHEPKSFLLEFKPKLIVINKVFHSKIILLAKEARDLNIKVISVFDDWHFGMHISKKIEQRFINNKILANNSNNIVVKTKKAADLIYQNTGLRAKIISDCLRFKSHSPIKEIIYPFKISWFGMYTNHDTLKYGIEEILEYDFNVNLKIITNKINELQKRLNYLNLKNINLEFIDWYEKMDQEILKTDIVIIPYINDYQRIVKSYNRILDSINLGRFTIISNLGHLRKFEDYCFIGNIGQGLEWAKKNNSLAIEKVKKGLKFVQNNYDIATISKEWKKLIDQTL